jgi:hypothetical protein
VVGAAVAGGEVVEPSVDDAQPLLLERSKVTDGGGDLAEQQVLAK